MNACKHNWIWVEPPQITCIGDVFLEYDPDRETYNALCTMCGQRVWAHR